jgi:steroid 5-alpha reductase family enzyme
MSSPALFLAALGGLVVVFSAVYLIARRLDNYGFVDVAWSYGFAALAVYYAVTGGGWMNRRLLLAGMVTLWSLRLGTHLLLRVARHHPTEDVRYTQLRRDWAGHFHAKMFGFFGLQAASIPVLGLGFVGVMQNGVPRVHPLEIAGALVWLAGLVGEATADTQLAAFRHDPANRGRVCAAGLWRYSRHPNYFFEWLIWVGYALFALASPWGWLGLIGPAGILFLLLRVTGVPLAEAQSLRSKPEAYRRYQAVTSAFFPRPPRSSPRSP